MAYKFDKKEEHLYSTYVVDEETAQRWLKHYGKELESSNGKFPTTHNYYQMAKEMATRLATFLGKDSAIAYIEKIHKDKLKYERANGRIDYGHGKTKKVKANAKPKSKPDTSFGLKPSN